jgi:hyperosmotically inducible protein
MRKLKQFRLIQIMVAGSALLIMTGCKTRSSSDERSEGRTMDDKKITETALKKLKQEPVFKFNGVEVTTFGGVTQLSGFVNTEEQKTRAAEIVQQVEGVHQVVNGIAIKPEAMTPTGSTNAAQPRIYSQ